MFFGANLNLGLDIFSPTHTSPTMQQAPAGTSAGKSKLAAEGTTQAPAQSGEGSKDEEALEMPPERPR